ncbi:hypothetical protein [Sporosarcina sp. FSL K6-5500]|uniref:hypothetical protein n=1 Tax=Sporosarcina sp. FSL K6-5500 TaxID=2921558 RepID=UPI0030F916E6
MTVAGKVATISVKGLTYGNATTVTVANPAHTATVTVPQVSELFTLDITTDAKDDTIKSDGSTKTQITVTLKDKLTGKTVTDKDGIIQFSATRGGLGQTTSALQNGVATVQLTSEASAVSHTSTVTATVSNVPGAAEFEGLSGQKAVIFSPEGSGTEGQVKFVTATSADSSQGDRLFVVFSDAIKAADYKKAIADKATIKGAPTSLEYGIQVNGRNVAVSDVVNKTANTLEFILDTDVVGNATTANYKRIEAGWAGVTTQKNYLRDNVEHKVSFGANVGNLVLANDGTNLKFILTDTSKPGVLGVSAKDQLEFSVRFTESMDETTIEELVGSKNPNFLLDGREVLVIPAASVTPGDVAAAKAANQVILTSLQVGNYSFEDKDGKPTNVFANAVKAVDTRNVTTFKVHKDFALAGGVHQIQIAKVGDWAQDVHPAQNLIATDTFDFNVAVDGSIPAATIEVQSAEQWLVKFDKPVYTTGSKTAKDVFALKSADTTDTFVFDTDYIVSTIDKDGLTGTQLAPGASISGAQYFLIEFKNDWTDKYKTAANPLKTYFASTKNPYVVTLDHLESAIGNKVGKKELDVSLSYDGESPKIANATQVKTPQGAFTSGVRVVMSEPVKNVVPASNNEGLTPSQTQALGTGVPEPTYEFVKGDKVVKATASLSSYDNKAFTLSPDGGATLEAGEWTLFIRSISDDIGNTSATESHKVTIVAADQAVTGTRLAWAAFDDEAGTGKLLNNASADFDVVYAKFTKVMKADGSNGVSRTQNYVFMGQPLPEGSTVQKGITGVTNDWDGVTILMPKGTWNGTDSGKDFTNTLNIASNFVSAENEALSGKYAVELTDTDLTTAVVNGIFEAVYTDAGETSKPSQATFGSLAQVTGASASDASANGKIDTVTLKLNAKHGVIAAGIEVLVNGKTFVTTAALANAGSITLTSKNTATDQIDGTTTNGLKITGKDGSIIVNTGSVKDQVAPVITKAVVNAAGDQITVTFSENIQSAVVANTNLTVTGTGTLATAGAVEVGDNYLVFNVSPTKFVDGDKIDVTVGQTVIKDVAGNNAAAIDGAVTTNDVKVTGITVGGGGASTTGVTATSAVQGAPGVATVTPVTAVQGINTITFTGAGFVLNDTVTIDGQVLTLPAGPYADGTAVATAVNTLVGANPILNAKYSTGVAAGVLTLTQKVGQESLTATTVATNAAVGNTAVAANPTPGVIGVTGVVGTASTATFKIATGATKSGNIKVTVKKTVGGVVTPVATDVSVAVTAGMTKEQVAAAIGAIAGLDTALINTTQVGVTDEVLITEVTPFSVATYTVTVTN